MVSNATSLRSQEFIDDQKMVNQNEYKSMMEAKKQFGESQNAPASSKPLAINLKAMRRTSQASGFKQSSDMNFIQSERETQT